MKFPIEIKEGFGKKYYNVERLPAKEGFEQYRVWNDTIDIVLQSNRPMLRAKGLKSKPPIWKKVSGPDILGSKFERFTKSIMKVIEQY